MRLAATLVAAPVDASVRGLETLEVAQHGLALGAALKVGAALKSRLKARVNLTRRVLLVMLVALVPLVALAPSFSQSMGVGGRLECGGLPAAAAASSSKTLGPSVDVASSDHHAVCGPFSRISGVLKAMTRPTLSVAMDEATAAGSGLEASGDAYSLNSYASTEASPIESFGSVLPAELDIEPTIGSSDVLGSTLPDNLAVLNGAINKRWSMCGAQPPFEAAGNSTGEHPLAIGMCSFAAKSISGCKPFSTSSKLLKAVVAAASVDQRAVLNTVAHDNESSDVLYVSAEPEHVLEAAVHATSRPATAQMAKQTLKLTDPGNGSPHKECCNPRKDRAAVWFNGHQMNGTRRSDLAYRQSAMCRHLDTFTTKSVVLPWRRMTLEQLLHASSRKLALWTNTTTHTHL